MNLSTMDAIAPPSGMVRVDALRVISAYRDLACPPVAWMRRSGATSADTATMPFSRAIMRVRFRKKVLPDPYSPMTKRIVAPPPTDPLHVLYHLFDFSGPAHLDMSQPCPGHNTSTGCLNNPIALKGSYS